MYLIKNTLLNRKRSFKIKSQKSIDEIIIGIFVQLKNTCLYINILYLGYSKEVIRVLMILLMLLNFTLIKIWYDCSFS